MKIGIMGFGVVGRALFSYYRTKHEVWHYDIATDTQAELDALNRNADVVFICVGTPYAGEGKGLDTSDVYAAVDSLTGSKTVIIKSTVNPGTTDDIQAKHPEHRVFFVPEFLSEDTAADDYANPRRPHIIGCTEASWPSAECPVSPYLPHYSIVDSDGCLRRIVYLPARQAELLKLATNAFYAMKVTFANQMYDLGMTQETLDALAEDPWIVASHFKIEHKGDRGYGGKCLPKDTNALITYHCQTVGNPGFIPIYCDIYNDILRKANGSSHSTESE